MPAYRFFTPELQQNHQTLLIKDKEHHHIKHVMKVKTGESIELINGKGGLGKAEILEMKKNATKVCIKGFSTSSPPTKSFGLAQSFCQDKKKMAHIVEKACEMGCGYFWFFPSEKGGEKTWYQEAEKKWLEVAVSALKQSGNLFLPKITLLPSLIALKNLPASLLYGSLKTSDPSLFSIIQKYPQSQTLTFIVGPESGFSEEEEKQLSSFAQPSTLHPYTLRVETAATVAMGLISHWLLDRKK